MENTLSSETQTKEKNMFKNKKVSILIISTLALILAVGLVAFSPFDSASAATPEDGLAHRGGPGGFDPRPPRDNEDTYLLDALGITAEELQAAHEAAQAAAIDQALEEGLITQTQVDRLTQNRFRNFQLFAGPDSGIDMESLLAEALGISVDELSAARESAKAAAIEQAIADGKITEEQAALMEARQSLSNFVEKDELVAKALGISTEELQVAQEDGKRIPDLLEELGLDQETCEANLQAAHEEMLQQAVEDGILTQEQADLILENGLDEAHGGGPGRFDHFPGGREGSLRGFPGRPDNGGMGE
jgi:flagellar basal body-associated protein FliL